MTTRIIDTAAVASSGPISGRAEFATSGTGVTITGAITTASTGITDCAEALAGETVVETDSAERDLVD
jgi:hypothetical protein